MLGATTPPNIISLADFKKQRESGEPVKTWPTAVPPESMKNPVSITTRTDPAERKVLLSLLHGDIIMSGILGLSSTFLAVGDSSGAIKFAAAPSMWLYARDITDDPTYKDVPISAPE